MYSCARKTVVSNSTPDFDLTSFARSTYLAVVILNLSLRRLPRLDINQILKQPRHFHQVLEPPFGLGGFKVQVGFVEFSDARGEEGLKQKERDG